MATVNIAILKHQKKANGTWNVKIRVTQGNQSAYISTGHYVVAKQLKKDFTLKDVFVIDMVNEEIAKYRKQISGMTERVQSMSARDIANELGKRPEPNHVDFGALCVEHIAYLRKVGRKSSARTLNTVYQSLCDFFGYENFLASEITIRMLNEYQEFLKGDRVMYRKNPQGRMVKIVRPGLGSGLFNYMRDLRLLFNVAKDKFNDEDNDIYRIPHNPFRKFKIDEPPEPEKRNLTIDQIRSIRDCQAKAGTLEEFSRDIFMLSFYLCGINSADLHAIVKENVVKGRLNYNRAKTKGRRKDRAFISIKIPSIAEGLIEKYITTNIVKNRYATPENLNKGLNRGLKEIGKRAGIDSLTFYYARHTFADTARNKCRFSVGDVGMALNHIDRGHKTTDKYISRDWTIVDEVQEAVLSLLG